MVTVRIIGEKDERKVEGKNPMQILHSIGINTNSVIILRNGKPIPEDEDIEEGDEITVIRSFSGG
jgi:sulfur carrier protein